MSNAPRRNVFYLRVDASRGLTDNLFRRPFVDDTEIDDDPYDHDRHVVEMERSTADARSFADHADAEFPDARGKPVESGEHQWDMENPEHFIEALDSRRRLAIVAVALSLALFGSAGVLGYKLFSSSGNGLPVKADERSNVAGPPTQVRDNAITPDPDRPHVVRSETATGFSLSSMQLTPALTAPRPIVMEDRSMTTPVTVDTRLPNTDVSAEPPAQASISNYLVQFSSQRSEIAAQVTSRTMQAKYGEFFRGRRAFVRRSDTGKRGVYYRGLVGPFATAQEAKEVCSRLKRAGADCVVQHN
jgi:hypothetical protein